MLNDLVQLRNSLLHAGTLQERISILDSLSSVNAFDFKKRVQDLTPESEYVLKQLAAIGQLLDPQVESIDKWNELLRIALSVDHFYREIGGIVGYQVEVLSLIQKDVPVESSPSRFHSPMFDDISQETAVVKEQILCGLKSMPLLAELYPLGGAADRLHLLDEQTGEELPAAKLQFCGRSLIESLIRDLQAREWLYFRMFGQQITTPIAIMSSWEKDNCLHVEKIFEDHQWFGRSVDQFRFFIQPLVPAFNELGNWHQSGPLKPVLKPGGHGAIWKLARDEGVFSWLKDLGRKKALLRQINNPIAGLDYGLIAFAGIGFSRNMSFGFASCDRLVKSAEGVVVLVEKPTGEVALTNIEYCDFPKFGINDEPIHPDHPYSRFSSNTNILFADLDAVENAVKVHPFPGLLMNLKPSTIVDETGIPRLALIARLESTMQNIADVMIEMKTDEFPLKTEKTFVAHNKRHKTISVAKKAYQPGKSIIETPELCFYELLLANAELLAKCGFMFPKFSSPEMYMEKGPSTLFLYHPAFGPLYSIIAQKLRGGHMTLGSELNLEIAELDVENLSLDGSLQIRATQVLGEMETGILRYSHKIGRAILHNVSIENKGVDWAVGVPYWRMHLYRAETVQVDLKGWSEFDARDVQFKGSHHFVVEDGVKMVVRQGMDGLLITRVPMSEKILWDYSWENGVQLKKAP